MNQTYRQPTEQERHDIAIIAAKRAADAYGPLANALMNVIHNEVVVGEMMKVERILKEYDAVRLDLMRRLAQDA